MRLRLFFGHSLPSIAVPGVGASFSLLFRVVSGHERLDRSVSEIAFRRCSLKTDNNRVIQVLQDSRRLLQ